MRTNNSDWTRAVADEEARIVKMRRLYDGDHGAVFLEDGNELPFKLVIPNLCGEGMTDVRSDLVFCEFPRILPTPPNDSAEPDVEYQQQIADLVAGIGLPDVVGATERRRSFAGYSDWKIVTDPLGKGLRLRLWGARDGEFCTWEEQPATPGFARAVNFWSKITLYSPVGVNDRDMKGVSYRIRERHAIVNDAGEEMFVPTIAGTGTGAIANLVEGAVGDKITYAAWRIEHSGPVLIKWEDMQAEYVKAGFSALPDEQSLLAGITTLPGYRIDNTDFDGDGTGNSDYTWSRRNLQWNVILISSARNFATAITTVPQITLSPDCMRADGSVDWQRIALRVNNYDDPDSAPVEIKSWIGHLGESDKVLAELLADWDRLSPISPVLLGRSVGSDQSGTSIRLSLLRTERSVTHWRQAYNKAFLWALRYASAFYKEYASQRTDIPEGVESISVEWPPAIPEEINDVVMRLTTAYNDKCLSRDTYIRLFHNNKWTDKQVQVEMDKIEGEAEADAVLAPTALPAEGEPVPDDGQEDSGFPPLAGDRSQSQE